MVLTKLTFNSLLCCCLFPFTHFLGHLIRGYGEHWSCLQQELQLQCVMAPLWPLWPRYGRIMRLWPPAAARLMARNCSNQFGHNYPENHGAWSSWYSPRLCKEIQLNTRVTQCDDYLILWEGPNCILLVEAFIPLFLHALTTSSRKKAQSSVQSGINDINQGQTGGGGYVR